jgi:hypothetical protein
MESLFGVQIPSIPTAMISLGMLISMTLHHAAPSNLLERPVSHHISVLQDYACWENVLGPRICKMVNVLQILIAFTVFHALI